MAIWRAYELLILYYWVQSFLHNLFWLLTFLHSTFIGFILTPVVNFPSSVPLIICFFFYTLLSSIPDFRFYVGIIPSSTLETVSLYLRYLSLMFPTPNTPLLYFIGIIFFSLIISATMLVLFHHLHQQIFLWLMVAVGSSFSVIVFRDHFN